MKNIFQFGEKIKGGVYYPFEITDIEEILKIIDCKDIIFKKLV